MKYGFLLVICVLAKQVEAGLVSDFLKCAVDSDVAQSKAINFRMFRNSGLSEAGQCISACLMKAIGVIDDNGKISSKGIMDIVRTYTTDAVTIGKGEVIVLRCGIEANEETETCATVLTFNRCVQETSQNEKRTKTLPELNLTLPPITVVLAFLSLL